MSHTPGPWELGDTSDTELMVYCNDSLGSRVADCHNSGHGITTQQDHANARLIAAAPDLFEALDPDTLEAIADEIGLEFRHSARALSLRVIARKQREAIAKATGEQAHRQKEQNSINEHIANTTGVRP